MPLSEVIPLLNKQNLSWHFSHLYQVRAQSLFTIIQCHIFVVLAQQLNDEELSRYSFDVRVFPQEVFHILHHHLLYRENGTH